MIFSFKYCWLQEKLIITGAIALMVSLSCVVFSHENITQDKAEIISPERPNSEAQEADLPLWEAGLFSTGSTRAFAA